MHEIRTYTRKDYHDLIKLWINAGLGLTLSDIENEITKFASFNTESFFVLLVDTEIIGSVIATFDGRRGYVYHLAVSPDYQGFGYGKLLMETAERYFHDSDVVKIHLMVDRHNSEVTSFYEKLGWVLRDDIIVMSKSLRKDRITIKSDRVDIDES